MFNFRHILSRRAAILLVLAVLAVAAGLIINQNGNEFVVPTAIGDTNKAFIESDDFQHLERANRAFISLVKQTRQSVVQITTVTERKVERTNPSYQIIPPDGIDRDDLRRFLERFDGDLNERYRIIPSPNNQESIIPSIGIGSGVIVSEDGYILTNNHVIDRADEIKVTLENGKEYPAKLIGSDPSNTEVSGTDLAVLKIDAKDLPALPFGDSDALEVGEWVIAIGTPFNLHQTVTRGIVSAKNRTGTSIKYGNFIQTDTPINKGNSGGALINIRGELVGINTLIATNGLTSGNIGIGFAIPSNTASELLPKLIEDGKIVRSWLGIRMKSVSHDVAEKLKFDEPRGAFVVGVGQGSPAEKAGIRPGDVILEFNEHKIEDFMHLMNVVAYAGVGATVKVKVFRNGEEIQLSVKLEKRTEEAIESLDTKVSPDSSHVLLAGIRVQSLTPDLAKQYGHQEVTGVIVKDVEQGSVAARSGVKPGFLIKEIDYTKIDSLEDYESVVEQLKKSDEKLALIYFINLRQRGIFMTLNVIENDR